MTSLVVGWLVVSRWLVGCHARALWPNGASYAYSYYGTLIGNPNPGIQWYNFRTPGVTPNRGMPLPREALFVKLLWPLVLLQSVSWTAQPKYNTQTVATSNDFVTKTFLNVLDNLSNNNGARHSKETSLLADRTLLVSYSSTRWQHNCTYRLNTMTERFTVICILAQFGLKFNAVIREPRPIYA